MCLAVAARVTGIFDNVAVVDIDGMSMEASSLLLPDLTIGEWVLVHAGFVMERIDQTQAKLIQEAYHKLAESAT